MLFPCCEAIVAEVGLRKLDLNSAQLLYMSPLHHQIWDYSMPSFYCIVYRLKCNQHIRISNKKNNMCLIRSFEFYTMSVYIYIYISDKASAVDA